MTQQPTPSQIGARRADFRKLHEAGCFLIPNPWDVGSARYLASLGFKALASTSSGWAWSLGERDGGPPLEAVLAHLRQLVAATELPVNADFEHGFAAEPEGVARNVRLAIDTGIAGLSIEDSTGDPATPLFDLPLAVERMRAARAAIDASGEDVMLIGRAENFVAGRPDLQDAIGRLQAYAEAGADCLYAPRITDPEIISRIVKAVAPKPVNALMVSPVPGLTFSRLADLGVRRISVGSALSRVALGAFIRAAQDILTTGNFDTLGDAAPFKDLNDIFSQQ